jgi:hypothetical protein
MRLDLPEIPDLEQKANNISCSRPKTVTKFTLDSQLEKYEFGGSVQIHLEISHLFSDIQIFVTRSVFCNHLTKFHFRSSATGLHLEPY